MHGILQIFHGRDRAKLAGLICLIVLNGLLEVFGIGLLFPYVAILQNPGRVAENPYLKAIYSGIGFESSRSFLIAMSVGLLAVFVAKGAFGIWVQSTQVRFVFARQSEFGQRLLGDYLRRPYEFFLCANTANLIGNLTTSLNQFCSGVLQSTLSLMSEIVVICGLMAFLVFVSPIVSMVAIFFVVVVSFGFIRIVRSRIARYASENDARWKTAIRVVNESMSAAKEVQVFDRAGYFVDAYGREMRSFATAVTRYNILTQFPKTLMETLAVAGLIFVAVSAILSDHDSKDLFALLAVFAVATVRIVPSANRIIQAWHAISFQMPAFEIVRSSLEAAAMRAEEPEGEVSELRLRKVFTISIKNFSYPTNPLFRLRDIDLEIRQGQTIAFIGPSGSGKTTLIDLLLGFYPNFEGHVEADGCDIRRGIRAWRRNIGYIPQTIFLRDDTITRNVAFGLPDELINIARVRQVITLAGLDNVIAVQANGLDTIVGDRGIRLSGGERQRIGIARALYHDPDLLVMDEATSALDSKIERQIVNAIVRMSPAKTVIVIAHRLSTVRHCDVVVLMRNGFIVDRGSFDEIATRNADFIDSQDTNVPG